MKNNLKLLVLGLVITSLSLQADYSVEDLISAVSMKEKEKDQMIDKVEMILKAGVRPDTLSNGESALHWLALNKNLRHPTKVLSALLAVPNVNVNIQNSQGQTPLYLAAEGDYPDFVLMLLQKGANPNIASNTNTTPLSIAAENGKTNLIKILLEGGAQATTKNKWGNDAIANAERSIKNKGTKWTSSGMIKDWEDMHPSK